MEIPFCIGGGYVLIKNGLKIQKILFPSAISGKLFFLEERKIAFFELRILLLMHLIA